MYSEADTIKAKSALDKFIVLYSILAAVSLGGMVTFIILRIAWPLYVLVALFTLLTIFLWGNQGTRLVAYNRFLKELNRGLEREVVGVILSIDEDEATKDGMEFRGLRLMVAGDDTDKTGGRLLYVDCTRFPIKGSVGQRVSCRLFGNYIKDMEILEDN